MRPPTEHASIVAGFVKQIAEQLIAALPADLQDMLKEVPVAVQETVRRTLEKPEIKAAIGKLPSDVTLANIDKIAKDAQEQLIAALPADFQFSIQDIVTKILETPEIKAAIGQFLPDINITAANIDQIAKDALSHLLPALPADIQVMLKEPSVTIGAIIKQILETPELEAAIGQFLPNITAAHIDAKDAVSQLLAGLPADIQDILKEPSVTIDKLSKILETPELKAAIGQFLPNMTAGNTEQIAKDALEQLVAALPLDVQEIAKEALKRLGAKSQASTWTLIGTNGVAYSGVSTAP
jgi:predicted Zn-dependent protease with MMP-like domain